MKGRRSWLTRVCDIVRTIWVSFNQARPRQQIELARSTTTAIPATVPSTFSRRLICLAGSQSRAPNVWTGIHGPHVEQDLTNRMVRFSESVCLLAAVCQNDLPTCRWLLRDATLPSRRLPSLSRDSRGLYSEKRGLAELYERTHEWRRLRSNIAPDTDAPPTIGAEGSPSAAVSEEILYQCSGGNRDDRGESSQLDRGDCPSETGESASPRVSNIEPDADECEAGFSRPMEALALGGDDRSDEVHAWASYPTTFARLTGRRICNYCMVIGNPLEHSLHVLDSRLFRKTARKGFIK
jgi:hypothetical protein